jgi:hypothetical protein
MRGLENISDSNTRVIKDFKMKERTDESAEIIIQQVFRIFYFHLKSSRTSSSIINIIGR